MSMRVFLVEDEPLIAMMLEDMLEALGIMVVGLASHLQEAVVVAASAEFDAAILDVNLRGCRSYPVADILIERRIPYLFATGYGADALDPRYAGASLLKKPYCTADVERALLMLRARPTC